MKLLSNNHGYTTSNAITEPESKATKLRENIFLHLFVVIILLLHAT